MKQSKLNKQDELQEALQACCEAARACCEAARAYHETIRQLPTSPDRCVYVQGMPGIEAVRIGRTVDLLQRVSRFEYSHCPIEVILVGECTAYDNAPQSAEAKLFNLLQEIHLSRHNPDLYRKLPTYDWYLPDRRKILDAFTGLCRTDVPLFTRFYKWPLFEQLTNVYS